MRVVRRAYFYVVSFISVQVVLWGVITLLNSLWSKPAAGGLEDLLARGLSQVFIGVPIFIIHWRIVRRDARQAEEQASYIRAIFLYALRASTLVPVLVQGIILLRCLLMAIFATPSSYQGYLAAHRPMDSFTIAVVNFVVWYAVELILRQDWKTIPETDTLANIRRIYRYAWLLLSLGTLVVGLQMIISYILNTLPEFNRISTASMINGITLAVVAAPVWAWTWRLIGLSCQQDEEKHATIRLIVFFVITMVSVAVTLSMAGMLANDLLQWLFGQANAVNGFINQHSSVLANGMLFCVLWLYYSRSMHEAISDQEDPVRQRSLQHVYATILTLAGNIVTFIGVWTLLVLMTDQVFNLHMMASGWRDPLSRGLAELLVGLPLWLKPWRTLQQDTTQDDEIARHARRFTLRKVFLYLVIFASVIGLMSAGGYLIYRLVNAVFGNPIDDLAHFTVKQILLIGQILVWLLYHQRILRQDNLDIQQAMQARHAAYKTLVLEPEAGWPQASQLVGFLKQQLPELPVTRVAVAGKDTIEGLQDAAAVIMPAQLPLHVSAAIQQQLAGYAGKILVYPLATEQVTYINTANRNQRALMNAVVNTLRQLSEGRDTKSGSTTGGWAIAGYILGAFVAFYAIMIVFSLFMGIR